MATLREATKATQQYDIPLPEDEFGGAQANTQYYTPTATGSLSPSTGYAAGFSSPLYETGRSAEDFVEGARKTTKRGGITFLGSPLGGGGAAGTASPIAQVSTSKTVSATPAPELNLPKYNEKEISKRAQRLMAPYRRQLSRELRAALSVAIYENPAVAKEIQRGALAGYGEAMSKGMAAAETAATQEYGAQYAREAQAAQATWQAAMAAYNQGLTQVSSVQKFYTQEDLDDYLNSVAATAGNSGIAVGGARAET